MPDHIPIGKVGDNKIIFADDALYNPAGHLRRLSCASVRRNSVGKDARSSSPSKGWPRPPLKKKVTCANFSDSAV
jgi:hypothetical protein